MTHRSVATMPCVGAGVFRLPAPASDAAGFEDVTNQPPVSTLREPAPAETVGALPPGTAVHPATDAVFGSRHQPHPLAPSVDAEVEDSS
jgi:hypothetical protein